ncbi:MAG: hypothetical protein H0W23_10045, partial [Chloroflexia bacterium]|nr:hypothetical protein [Chloroflexia bacterium]
MSVPDRQPLRRVIDEHQGHLRAGLPRDRAAAVLAIIRVQDRLPHPAGVEPPPDLVTGRRLAGLGTSKALQLLLESDPDAGDDAIAATAHSGPGWDGWAERFLDECGRLAAAELVLGHCETGFMRIVDDGNDTFDAWIATKREPTSWRERADIDWWAASLSRRYAPALRSARPNPASDAPEVEAWYRRVAGVHLEMMTYQLGYPLDVEIGGCTIQTYRDVLAWLIGWELRAHDRGDAAAPRSERSLVAAIGSALAVDPEIIGRAVAAFTLDREAAAYHAAVPGVAAAPLVRISPDLLVASLHGLTTEPLLFLTRELKRCESQEYHNTAFHREIVFRGDLSVLFADKRFVTSSGAIKLRRDAGDLRTDIDAVVFDRKTGTLGVFELKSQDPFARSSAELARQRDNVLYANRQVSGVLDWLRRHGGDDLLRRVDAPTAKRFRVHKVYPFV